MLLSQLLFQHSRTSNAFFVHSIKLTFFWHNHEWLHYLPQQVQNLTTFFLKPPLMNLSHLVSCLTLSPIEFIYSTRTYRLSSPSLLLLLVFCSFYFYFQANPFQNFPPEILSKPKSNLFARSSLHNKNRTSLNERLGPISFSRHK